MNTTTLHRRGSLARGGRRGSLARGGMSAMSLLVLVCVAISPLASAITGTVADNSGTPVPYAYVGLLDSNYQYLGAAVSDGQGGFAINANTSNGLLFVQPNATLNAQGLGIYANAPRTYLVHGEQAASIRIPATGCIVLQGYDAGRNLMRWANYVANGTVGGQFVYATNTDDELREASCWPVYDDAARAQGSPRDLGLPALVVEPGKAVEVNVLFWQVPGYGKLLLKADNGGAGFQLGAPGQSIVLDLNVELASTAVADLVRRQSSFASSASTSIANLVSALAAVKANTNAVARAAAADSVLSQALKLRDDLELQAAQTNISSVRKGNLTVVVKKSGKAQSAAKVAITQRAHSFKFGSYIGGQFNSSVYQSARDAGFEMATMLFGWSWMEQSPNVLLDPAIIDSYYGITAAKNMGFDVKAHGVVWMQGYGILPQRTYTMAAADVQAQALQYQQSLINAFKTKISSWEAMNEAPATNALNMSRDQMNNLLASAASNIKALAGLISLVNSPHENSFGAKYAFYTLDNLPYDNFSMTYSDCLKQFNTAKGLSKVDSIGIQYYPGYKLNASFNYQEGPAMTPSWFVDMTARYNQFSKPIHITEFSVPSYRASDWNNGYWREPWTETTQADYAERIFTQVFSTANVQSITWWDMSDANCSVLNGGLMDASGRKKAAYTRIQSLIKSWTTMAQGTTNTSGTTTLSGFGGAYDVTITLANGTKYTRTATIGERATATLNVTL